MAGRLGAPAVWQHHRLLLLRQAGDGLEGARPAPVGARLHVPRPRGLGQFYRVGAAGVRPDACVVPLRLEPSTASCSKPALPPMPRSPAPPCHWHLCRARISPQPRFEPHRGSASSDEKVRILRRNADDSWDVKVVEAHQTGCNSVSWAPASATRGMQIVTGGCDNKVKLWQCVDEEWEEVKPGAQPLPRPQPIGTPRPTSRLIRRTPPRHPHHTPHTLHTSRSFQGAALQLLQLCSFCASIATHVADHVAAHSTRGAAAELPAMQP